MELRQLIVGALLLVMCSVVNAQQDYPRDMPLSWTNASEYIDDTPIEAGDLTGVKVDCYRQNETVPILSAVVPATGEGLPQAEVFVGAIPKPGTYRCEAFSVVIGDIYSDASIPTFKKYVGKPKRVTGFTSG